MTITTEERNIVAALKALPGLPTVVAKDMLHAQGVKFADNELAAMRERSELFVKLGMNGQINIRVEDHFGVRIGTLVFFS